jgi:hypothetical protein
VSKPFLERLAPHGCTPALDTPFDALDLLAAALSLLQAPSVGAVLNTAFIERFNGTMRGRLANLTRRCRHAASRLEILDAGVYLIGCTYNFCWLKQELSQAPPCRAGMCASNGK